MENRKLITIGLLLFFLGITSPNVFAYSTNTHAYLTEESTLFYNQHYEGNKIFPDLIPYLIDGSRKEDEAPRWMNHFYDPTYQKGLSDPILGSWESAKMWSRDDKNQNAATYKIPSTIASILTAIQQKNISALSFESAFTWEKAMRYWIQGEKEKALFSLGHVLHLLQDMAVPEHTRNDAHPGDSPYEEFADKYTQITPDSSLTSRLQGKTPISLDSLDSYFDDISKYSNENFYSKDTIGIQSSYSNPTPDFVDKCLGYYCGFVGKSDDFHKLFIKEKPSLLGVVDNDISLFLNKRGGEIVLEDYWRLLSAKAAQGSAGVINLFFEEAERNKDNPEFTKEKTSLLGQVLNSIKNLFGSKNNPITQISLQRGNNQQQTNQQNDESQQNQSNQERSQEDSSNTVKRVIDGDTIVLNNGEIVRYIGINAPELSDDPTKSACFAQEARKANEQLTLGKKVRLEKSGNDRDIYGRLLRYVWVDDVLINQELVTRGLVYSFNFNIPHPKEDEFEFFEKEAQEKKLGLWGSSCEQEGEDDKNKKTTLQRASLACTPQTNQSPTHLPVIINEVAWMGTSQGSANEWIELKNISSFDVDLSGWAITDKDSQISIVLGADGESTVLKKGSFYLLERSSDDTLPSITADALYNGTLSNSGEELRLFDAGCLLVDEVVANPSWPAGDNGAKRTMERDLSGFSWHTSQIVGGTPRSQNSSPYQGGGASSLQSSMAQQNPPVFYPLVINEIMYDLPGSDSGREWVELYNAGTIAVDIDGWKFVEGGSSHSITDFQGGFEILPNEYVVLADNPVSFLEEYPEYQGILLDSSFSLSNNGEMLEIKNQTLSIDAVSYNVEQGGAGNGNSLQKFESEWKEAPPTPGAKNNLPSSQTIFVSQSDHLLISEIQVSGESADDEFVEIYNPTESVVDLSNYSIQYVSGKADSLDNVTKRNVGDESIAPHSFFLIAHQDSIYAAGADLIQSSISLSGSSSGGIFLLVSTTTPITSLEDTSIVDMISYGSSPLVSWSTFVPNAHTSIERKAVTDSKCIDPIGEGQFLGNSCDTDTEYDFVQKETPTPQGKTNLPEPRNAPLPPQNFSTTHHRNLGEVVFVWDVTSDVEGSDNIKYEIYDDVGGDIIGNTTSTSFNFRYDEVGRDYDFFIVGRDRDGLASAPSDINHIHILSFITNLLVFQDEAVEEDHVLEMSYDSPQFIPDTTANPYSTWKMIVFYLNKEAPKDGIIYESEWSQKDDMIDVSYKHCSGSTYADQTLIIPDTEDRCDNSGGAYSKSIDFSQVGNQKIILSSNDITTHQNFTGNDFVTVAFYRAFQTMPSDGRVPYYELVAVDKTKYIIGSKPDYQSPRFVDPYILTTLDPETSMLFVEWAQAVDDDTPQNLLTYELRKNQDQPWITGLTSTSTTISVSPGDNLVIEILARDELSNISDSITHAWEYPRPALLIDQSIASDVGDSFGTKSQNCTQCPDTASLQSIVPAYDTSINFVTLRAKQTQKSEGGNLRLSLYPDAQGMPDYAQLLGNSVQHHFGLDGTSDVTFQFSPIALLGGVTYWLVLDVDGYDNGDIGYQRNQWRSVIATSDPYALGVAGKGAGASCDGFEPNYCSFRIPSPSSGADWYMKIGEE